MDTVGVVYCGVCTWPPEYCEFGPSLQKCKDWLESNHPSLFNALYSDAALTSSLANLTVEQREKAEKDIARKATRAEKEEKKAAEKKSQAKIVIKRVERSKRKSTTVISGLGAFQEAGDQKKLAKTFASRFSCGASVTRSPADEEEITIQGDVSDDVKDYLVDTLSIHKGSIILK